jgi:serine/threonine protein kinase
MEYCNLDNVELWLKTQPNGRVSESVARQIMRQVAKALYYLHALRIVHRALRATNLLLCSSNTDVPSVKLTGFYLARQVNADELMQTFAGAPLYMVCASTSEFWTSTLARTSLAHCTRL